MGVDQARTNNGTATTIASVSNPANAQYAQRQVRFIRIEKPVSIPDDDDIADPDNSAFGPTGVMREIVALRAGRARWLGAHESAGQHRVPDLAARRRTAGA